MPRINAPRIFSSKSTIDKMTKEAGLEGKTLREDEDRLEDFKRNPQKYIEEVTKIIRNNL